MTKRHALSCGYRFHEGDRYIRDQRDAYDISIDAVRVDGKHRMFRIDVAVLNSPDLPSVVCRSCLVRVQHFLRPSTARDQGGLF